MASFRAPVITCVLLVAGTWAEDAARCPTVQVQADFDLDAYVSKPWYIQQQMPVLYLPESQNFCVSASYARKAKASFWGYTLSVHNHAEEASGKVHDSGSFICARVPDVKEPAKLQVGPCFLPRISGFTTGPYWILSHNEEEGYALVSGGQPTIRAAGGCRTGSGVNNAGLWIFTRNQTRNDALVSKVRGLASNMGFDLSVLKDVEQQNCKPAMSADKGFDATLQI